MLLPMKESFSSERLMHSANYFIVKKSRAGELKPIYSGESRCIYNRIKRIRSQLRNDGTIKGIDIGYDEDIFYFLIFNVGACQDKRLEMEDLIHQTHSGLISISGRGGILPKILKVLGLS